MGRFEPACHPERSEGPMQLAGSSDAALPRLPQPHYQPHRRDEEKWRRVKSRRRARKRHRRHRVSQDRRDRVPHRVREMNERIEPCQRTQPTRASSGQRSQGKTKNDARGQRNQPLAKLKCWHGKPSPTLAQDGNGRVVDTQESSRGFIEHMQRKGHG